MIIDFILDRKGGVPYNAEKFYNYVRDEEDVFDFEPTISRALDSGTEKDIKAALCDYVIEQGYDKKICKYINSVNWLEGYEEKLEEGIELIRDLKKVVNVALNEAFEDKYTMDFECEGVEPTLVADKGAGERYQTWANVYTELMWSSGARPNNKNVAKYIDIDIESAERNSKEEYPNDEDKQFEYMMEEWNHYASMVEVIATPRFFINKNGFQTCDLTLEMRFVTYNGADIGKYTPKLISFSTVSKKEKINPNYVEEDDFEFFEGGYPVEEDVIKEFIRKSIAEYVAEF